MTKKKDKRTNNDLQNITRKTKDRITRTQLNTGFELGCSGRVSKSCSTSDTRCKCFLAISMLYFFVKSILKSAYDPDEKLREGQLI